MDGRNTEYDTLIIRNMNIVVMMFMNMLMIVARMLTTLVRITVQWMAGTLNTIR